MLLFEANKPAPPEPAKVADLFPILTFHFPVVMFDNACKPMAVFSLPVRLSYIDSPPTAVFLSPVVLELSDT